MKAIFWKDKVTGPSTRPYRSFMILPNGRIIVFGEFTLDQLKESVEKMERIIKEQDNGMWAGPIEEPE